MDRPLVSVVVPAYNAVSYIGEAIESVLAQTYSNWELCIVCDGGSTDNTTAVVREWAKRDPRIKPIDQEHVRMAAARNFGIARAKGKYVAFLDADNLFLKDKLEREVAYMETHPECGVCYSGIYHFYNDEPDRLYKNKNEDKFDVPAGADLFRIFLRDNFINVLAVLVRREVLEKYGAFPEGWSHCDEQYLWTNLAYHKVMFCPLAGSAGLLRLHGTNDSFRPTHVVNTARVFLRFLDVFESRLAPEEKEKYARDFGKLRFRWRVLRVVGALLITPPFSWILNPLFRSRRENAYYVAGTREELLVER